MNYIEPHAHMVSRSTDDYRAMVQAGCRVICEPAFWAGYDRGSVEGFRDYFRQITDVEPRRAAKFGIAHYSWLCINPKEAEDIGFAREVISLIPEFLLADGVLGIGEVGLNKNSKNELIILEEQVQLAEEHQQLILIHTPHLEDKLKGTRLILDLLQNHSAIDPSRVIVDHVEEHTISLVLEKGYWAGMTLYPDSKCSPSRAVDMWEQYGPEKLWINSACDWGVSKPLAVPDAILEMRLRGFGDQQITKMVWDNPQQFLSQSPKFSDKKSITL